MKKGESDFWGVLENRRLIAQRLNEMEKEVEKGESDFWGCVREPSFNSARTK